MSKNRSNFRDLKGLHFGYWKVLKRAKNRYKWKTYWICQCTCGKEKEVSAQTLTQGISTKCASCSISIIHTKHGFCKNGKKHLEYHIWNSIKNRCKNKNLKEFKLYGARGISICERWENSFENFILDMGKKPFPDATIERVDNDGNYEPSNCKWIPRDDQPINTRRNFLFEGKRICISRLAKEINRCRFWVSKKLKEGVSPSQLKSLEGPVFKNYLSRIDIDLSADDEEL